MFSSAQQKKKVSQNPFVHVRLLVNPPEGLKGLDIKLRKSTLFVEVVHGNEEGELNRQWLPLPLEHELKKPVEQKTHYGKKNTESEELTHSLAKHDFDLETIEKYIVTHSHKNKYASSISSAPDTKGNEQITLRIPISSGECQLVLTPSGDVSIHHVPTDLDLNITTHGSISTGADLKCRKVCLEAEHIENTHLFVADTMAFSATKKLSNSGVISGKDVLNITAGEELMNTSNAVLTSESGSLHIQHTPLLTNQGRIHGAQCVETATPTCLDNASTGTLTSDTQLALSLGAHNQNHGLIKAPTIIISAKDLGNTGLIESTKSMDLKTDETLDNQASGRIIAQESLLLTCKTMQNSGNIHALGAVSCQADNIIQNLKTSQLLSEQQLSLTAKTQIENAGIMSGDSVTLAVTDTTHGILQQWEGATISGNDKVSIDSHLVINAGLIQALFGTLIITEADQFKNLETGIVKTGALLDITARAFVNSGTAEALGMVKCQVDTLVQDRKTSNIKSDTELTLVAKTTLKNEGVLYGKQSAKMIAREAITNGKEAIVETEGVLKVTTPLLNNAGMMRGKNQTLSANNMENTGKILGEELNIIKHTVLENSGLVEASKKLAIETDTTITNRESGSLKAGEYLELNIHGLCNIGSLTGGAITITIASQNQPLYSFFNKGEVITTNGDFTFVGQGISHDAGSMTSQASMVIRAINIQLVATTAALKDIALHHGGGIWVVKDTVRAEGELGFYFPEGKTITEARTVPGSLKYALSPSATKPLIFLANQEAQAGHISVDAITSIIIGDDAHTVTFKSKKHLSVKANYIDLAKGRLLAVEDMQLKATGSIVLGREATRQVAIQSHGTISMEAYYIRWNQLEMVCGADLHLKGNGNLINTSSEIHIKGNALWAIHSRHQILVKNSTRIEIQEGFSHLSKPHSGRRRHRVTPVYVPCAYSLDSVEALTQPAILIIEGKLDIGHYVLDLFASRLSCKEFAHTRPAGLIVTNFVPFTMIMEDYISDYYRRKHTFHRDEQKPIYSVRPKVILGTPIHAVFSVGSAVKASIPYLNISGIMSAISLKITDIQRGVLGQFDPRISLAPMVVQSFNGQVSLVNYFEPTALYEISPGGETVYKAVLPMSHPTPMMPRMLINTDGTLTVTPGHLRRLFPREKEEQLLIKAMLGEFGRGFLSPELNTSQSIMRYLEGNAIRYGQTLKQLTDTQHSGELIHAQTNNALITQIQVRQEAAYVPEPCIVDKVETLVFADGHSESVVCSIVLFPPIFNNRRLRDGAGCTFALGDVTFSGISGSELYSSGNIDAQGMVRFKGFDTVSRTRTLVERQISVTQELRQKNMLGKIKTKSTVEQVVVLDCQPGNEIVAMGLRYVNVDNVHLMGANDSLGAGGLTVKGARTFIDEGILQLEIGELRVNKQRGILGMGGTIALAPSISQRALGSIIRSQGPICIQSLCARFDATQFKDAQGCDLYVTFEVKEMHFHELVRAIEAQEKSAAAKLKAQKKTADRKRRQGTMWLLVSIPVSYYVGAFVGGLLKGLGIAGVKLAVAQGAVMGATGSAIRGEKGSKIFQAALKGGLVAGVGYEVTQVLADASEIIQDIGRGAAVGATSAALNKGNVLTSAFIGGAAAGFASTVIPGADADLSMGEQISRAMVESATAALLNGSLVDDLAINLATSALGASVGRSASELGNKHGERLVKTQQPAFPIVPVRKTETKTKTALSESKAKAESGAMMPARRYGLVGGNFECELNDAYRTTHNLVLNARVTETLRNSSGGLRSNMLPMDNALQLNTTLLEPQTNISGRALLWRAPMQLQVKDDFKVFRIEANNPKQLSFLARVGRFSMQSLGFFGRKIGEVLDAHPNAKIFLKASMDASEIIMEVGVFTCAKLMGKEEEVSAKRSKLSQKFSQGMEKLSIAYSQKCREYDISKEDQAGAATVGLFFMSVTKAKTIVKLGNQVKRTAKQPSLTFTPDLSSSVRRSHHKQIPRSASTTVKGIGSEGAARKTVLRARYDVLPQESFKLPGNQGFDQVAFLRNPDGSIKKILIVESKYSHDGKLRLTQTKTKGKQMDPEWIDKTIEEMKANPNSLVQETAKILERNREKWVLKANVLNPNGINRWGVPTCMVEKLHQVSIQPRGPPRPGK